VDEDTLDELWKTTLGGLDPDEADPGKTYGQGALGAADEAQLSLPSFMLTRSGAGVSPRGALEGIPAAVDDSVTFDESSKTVDESGIATQVTPPPADPHGTVVTGASGAAEGGPSAGGAPYELQEVIGVGGMGVVYRARQNSLGRDVAIKTMKLEGPDAAKHAAGWLRKFVGEAHVTGRLTHPNVVPVYDLGQAPSGDAIIAMKLVEGATWKRLLHPKTEEERERAQGYDLEAHLRILDDVCNAVAFAHSRGVIHNDLKPENVIIGDFGEVLVMDWGLAMDVREAPQPGEAIPHKSELRGPCGTPAYMPPELALANASALGPQTDVYLLGAILFELLSGKAPHRGKTMRITITRAAKGIRPELPESAPEDLRALCLEAMARSPEDRVESVARFQERLRDHLTHRESLVITKAADDALEQAGAALQGKGEAAAAYDGFAQAIAGFAQARVLWPENPRAAAGEWRARLAYGEAALARGDLGLARTQAQALPAQTEAQAAQQRVLQGRVARAEAERTERERSARLVRRGLVGMTAAVVVGLSVGTALIAAERRRAEDNARRAEANARKAKENAARAEAERQRAQQRVAEALLAQGDMLGPAGRWGEARARYEESRELFESLGQGAFAAELGLLAVDHASPRPLLASEHTTTPGRRGPAGSAWPATSCSRWARTGSWSRARPRRAPCGLDERLGKGGGRPSPSTRPVAGSPRAGSTDPSPSGPGPI
jgi:hypothetical protein